MTPATNFAGKYRERAGPVCKQTRMMASILSFSVSSTARPLSSNLSRNPCCLRAGGATIASAYSYAFELAQSRPKRHVTSATKSNGIAITMPWWDRRVEAMAAHYPDIRTDKYHIDILAAQFVMNPDRFDVVVASNLFGDILSDLGPACTGTIGIAPCGNINPDRSKPSLFEPVHGSAPDIAGKGVANPVGQIWCGAMMLDHLGETEAAQAVMDAIEQVLAQDSLRTRDLGGRASTEDCGKAIAALLA